MDYARLYESRTGRLVLLHGVQPIRILLSPRLREQGFYRTQEDPGLEAMRVRCIQLVFWSGASAGSVIGFDWHDYAGNGGGAW